MAIKQDDKFFMGPHRDASGGNHRPMFTPDHQLTGGVSAEQSSPTPEVHEPGFVDPEQRKAAQDRGEDELLGADDRSGYGG